MTTIAVTGSTGRLGGRIARLLADEGVPQRLVVRDPSRARQLPVSEVVHAQYGDSEALHKALDGVDTALMVSASESLDRVAQHRNFVDAATAAGVEHLVYTSFVGASPNATFTLVRDHAATEDYIRASGLSFTILRDNLYADFFPFMVGEDGVIRGPAADGRVAAVVQDDIADVAAAVLTSPGDHVGATYELTGPEAHSLEDVAGIITASTGRDVSYHAETIDEAYRSRAGLGAPQWQLDAWVSTYTAIAAGELAAVTHDVARLSGHPATSLAALLS